VPVLVPAGSWLAEQIEPINQQWLESQSAALPPLQPATANARIELPPGARGLLLAFDWESPALPGRYLRVQLRAGPHDAPFASRIVGARDGAARVWLACMPPAGSTMVTLQLSAAWQADAAPPARWQGWQPANEALPAGLVGCTLAEPAALVDSVAQLLEHHGHYQAGARAWAAHWRHRQSGDRVIEALGAAILPAG